MGAYNAATWLLDRHVGDGRGDRVAVRSGGRDLTYESMLRETWRVQQVLAELGIGREERVVLMMNDSPEMIAWLLGSMRSGAIPVPVSTMLRPDDIAAIAADAGAAAVVVSSDYLGHIEAVRHATPSLRAAVHVDEPDGPTTPDSCRRWTGYTNDDEATVAGTTADSPAFWLYSLRDDRSPQGRHARPWQHAGHLRHVRHPRAGSHRRGPLPVRGQAVLRLRARQLPHVPLRRRRDHDPRTRAAHA